MKKRTLATLKAASVLFSQLVQNLHKLNTVEVIVVICVIKRLLMLLFLSSLTFFQRYHIIYVNYDQCNVYLENQIAWVRSYEASAGELIAVR